MDKTASTFERTHLPLYRSIAAEYREALRQRTLKPGERFPSVRTLMKRHSVSLSTAIEVCHVLEAEGLVEARPRSGYFVRHAPRARQAALREPEIAPLPDPAHFTGIHARVSGFIARAQQSPVTVDLSGATGAPELYPAEALRRGAIRALRRSPQLLAQTMSPNGNTIFREAIARRALDAGMTLSTNDIVITHGCIEALNIALRAVANPGDIVAVESPTFFGLLQILEALGMRALEIPTSPQTGLSIEALELALHTYPDLKTVVVVPLLQNPLGCVMPDAHKQRLISLCNTHGITLIEDDTYGALVEDESKRLAIKHWDTQGNVIHCASLHKIMAGGIRVGWISGGRHQARIEMLKYAQTRSSEELSQLAAADLLTTSAYDRHLRRLRATLADQRHQMRELVIDHFPSGTRLNDPAGGLILWVELPGNTSSTELFARALEHGIRIAPGAMFSNSNRFEHYIRLNCGHSSTLALTDTIKTLGQLVEQCMRGN